MQLRRTHDECTAGKVEQGGCLLALNTCNVQPLHLAVRAACAHWSAPGAGYFGQSPQDAVADAHPSPDFADRIRRAQHGLHAHSEKGIEQVGLPALHGVLLWGRVCIVASATCLGAQNTSLIGT